MQGPGFAKKAIHAAKGKEEKPMDEFSVAVAPYVSRMNAQKNVEVEK